MNGIDISNWQAGMNVAATDAEFVIVKATEGLGYVDPSCSNFANQTLNAGKLLGFYHFARSNDAVAEAEHFINTVRPWLGQAVLALDFEADAISNGVWWAKRWLDHVREETGITPIIYMSKSVCRSYDWSPVANQYELWAAQYPSYDPSGWIDNPWTDPYGFGAWGYDMPFLYQYRSVGGIPGYSGNLDKNKCYGARAQWLALQGQEDDMQLSDKLNDNKLPDGTNNNVANVLNRTRIQVDSLVTSVAALSAKVDKISAGGATVDYDKLANKVADVIYNRMKA